MKTEFIIKEGKKGAIYLPKKLMEKLGVQEGETVKAEIKENKIILEIIPDPFTLALKTKKWTKTSVEEFEKESELLQEELYDA